MILNSKDWKKLKTPILVLFTTIFLACILAITAFNFNTEQLAIWQAQDNQLQLARRQYQTSGAEKNEIIAYLPQYQALIDKGFIGEERRQAWIDALRTEQQNHKLFAIEYEMGQLQDFTPQFFTSLNNFVLHKSTMKINFDMLHEGDILQLTESLAEKNLTAWMLRSCEIIRLNQNDLQPPKRLQSNVANLHANCEIDWFTLLEPISTQPLQQP